MRHKSSSSRCIVIAAAIPGEENMTRTSAKCNPDRQHRVRFEYALRTTGSTAVVLFLFLYPALVWPQTAVPDKQSSPADEQQTQQSGSTQDSASQSDADTQSKPKTPIVTPEPVPTPADEKTDNSEGKQTKRMFWVVPNFAALSADTQLPLQSVREKFWLATQD